MKTTQNWLKAQTRLKLYDKGTLHIFNKMSFPHL